MTRQTEIFAGRIREERLRAGLSQVAMAARLSELLDRTLDPSALARSEKHDRPLRLDEALAIADVLKRPIATLVRDRQVIDDEIDELRRDLDLTQYRASQAQAVVEEAQSAMKVARRRIAELEEERGA